MAKYIYASVVIVVLAVGAFFVVRYALSEAREAARDEMDKTREALDQSIKDAAEKAASKGVKDALKGTPQTAQDTVETVAQGLGKTLGKFREGLSGSSAEKDKPDAPPAAPSQGGEKKKPPSHPADLIGDLFGAARDAAKAVDDIGQELVSMDAAQEKKLGREVHESVRKSHKQYSNARQLARVQHLARPLLEMRSRKDIDYTFTLIDGAEINAFSHLGGYVYLYKGLLDFCADDDMLQYVLGHEIAHVDLKHCVRGLNYAARADEATSGYGGPIVQMAYHLIALGYSEDQEFASDEWAYKSMRKLGKSHSQTVLFTRRFLDHLKTTGKPTGRQQRPTSLPGAVLQEIDNHFQSHPSAEDRLARLEKMKG